MYLFIKNCFLLFVIVVLVSFVLFFAFLNFWGFSYKDLPDLEISNSYYFNEKIALLRKRQPDIIGIGSSVTDTNLDSKAIIDEFGTKSFFNVGSGGITNKTIYEFLHIYNYTHKIKKVFVVGTFDDYSREGFHPDYERLRKYLSRTTYNQISLKKMSLPYLLSIRDYKRSTKDTINGSSARPASFSDFYGTRLLKKSFIDTELRRENKWTFDDDFKFFLHNINFRNNSLKCLDSISLFCKNNNIELYYIQSPINETYIAGRQDIRDSLEILTNLESKIVSGRGQHFVKSYNKTWNDSLFIDYQHLNEVGAAIFTREFLKECKNN